jgi:hypothetical protein
MISKEMYELLKRIPRHPQSILYTQLNKEDNEKLYNVICEANYTGYEYINVVGPSLKKGGLSLTEKGQAAIEEYEQAARNQKIVERSLLVSRVAMWAALGSAAAAIISLIKMQEIFWKNTAMR